jgi:hypothetical protein
MYHLLDLIRPASVLESVHRLLKTEKTWRYACYHHSLGITAKGVFEQPGQLGVSVGDELC